MRHCSRAAIAAMTTGLLLTACGATDDTSGPSSTETTPASDATTGDGEPMRIVSLSPTATETLFAIGAGDLVVAADSFSYYPPEAPTDEELAAFTPNAEAITAYEPDLVILGHNPDDIQAQLEALSIETAFLPAVGTIGEAYDQMEELGEMTGHRQEAADLVSSMQDQISDLVDSVEVPEGATYYHELDNTYYSATSTTFVGDVYGLFGLTSVADDVATDEDGGYPQLSAEHVLDSDPDLIFLADTDCCDVSAASIAERDGWDRLSAVQGGHVVELGDDIPSRWGPRIVDFVELVAKGVNDLANA